MKNIILGFIVFVGAFGWLYWSVYNERFVGASTVVGNDYISTTTIAEWGLPSRVVTLKTGYGNFGSVVVSSTTGSAPWAVYNATTSNIALRHSSMSTSSITLAVFPGSAAVGTYTFDSEFSNGLLVSFTGGVPTTTITWR